MVWIHGGAYLEGSANAYRPDFLLNNDVIVVSSCCFLHADQTKYYAFLSIRSQSTIVLVHLDFYHLVHLIIPETMVLKINCLH